MPLGVNRLLFHHPTEGAPSMKVQLCGVEAEGVQLPLLGQQGWGNGNFREVHEQISPSTTPQKNALSARSTHGLEFRLEETACLVEQEHCESDCLPGTVQLTLGCVNASPGIVFCPQMKIFTTYLLLMTTLLLSPLLILLELLSDQAKLQ